MVNQNQGMAYPSVELLKEIRLLRDFSEAELAKLLTIGKVVSYEAYSNVVIEGEMSWGLYLILEGVVGIFKANRVGGNVYDIGQLRTGNFFGEMSLIDNNPRSATVQALKECRLFYISKEDFNEFISSSLELKARFYETCIQDLVSRLRVLGDDYVVSQYQLWRTVINKEAA